MMFQPMKLAVTKMNARPVVFDYGVPHKFLNDLLYHYKNSDQVKSSPFSIRQRLHGVTGCSAALVTQVLKGRRRLTRDQLPTFSRIFDLTNAESSFLDELLKHELDKTRTTTELELPRKKSSHVPKNHILSSWLNLYVKDLVHLQGFKPDAKVLFKMLTNLATTTQIERSIQFLLREGFWRRTAGNQVIAEEPLLVSTVDVPDERIKKFHKQALKIAQRGIDLFPLGRRGGSATLIAVNQRQAKELKELIDSFHQRLQVFVEDCANESDAEQLIQVLIHFTPVGGKHG